MKVIHLKLTLFFMFAICLCSVILSHNISFANKTTGNSEFVIKWGFHCLKGQQIVIIIRMVLAIATNFQLAFKSQTV